MNRIWYELKADRDILEDTAGNAAHHDARKRAITALPGQRHLFDNELVRELTDRDFLYKNKKNQPDMGSGFDSTKNPSDGCPFGLGDEAVITAIWREEEERG